MIEVTRDLSEINDEIAKISYDDWLAFEDRFSLDRINTIKNKSKREEERYLLQSEGYYSYLDVALIDKSFYKINGIIRKKLWELGELDKPVSVIVRISKLKMGAYEKIINTLYPLSARNKAQDVVLSCYKKHNLEFNSDRLKYGYISDALNIALRSNPRTLQDKRTLVTEVNIDLAIATFKDELLLIDSFNPDKNIFLTGILSAAILMISIDKNNAEFFINLNALKGTTKNDYLDPCEALIRAIEVIKKKKLMDGRVQVEICSKAIKSCNLWNLGEQSHKYWIKRLSSVVFLPEIRKMKQIKQITHERGL